MFRRIAAFLALVTCLVPRAWAAEENYWPVMVERDSPKPAGREVGRLGPIYSEYRNDGSGHLRVIRPLLLEGVAGDVRTGSFLYPLFIWEARTDGTRFSFLSLVNRRDYQPTGEARDRSFDVWPFYFSRATGDPSTSYRALMPFHGTIRNRLGIDELSWTLFPLWVSTRHGETVTRHTPWPILRRTSGGGHAGVVVWPLYGWRARADDYRDEFWLWPLAYRSVRNLSAPQPDRRYGFLPFHTREQGPGYDNANYLWPLFGYTHRTEPARYDEIRYLWPFLVQGRGDGRRVNRWAPFYSRSLNKGIDKTWALWPVYREARWSADGVAQRKNQFLYFLYWSQTQTSLANPSAAPATRAHLWPLCSVWDNGAGRRQVQIPSPLEVFFPQNENIRRLYTPLFALYRYDRRGPGEERWSLLWDAITWRAGEQGREFHAGPLFAYTAEEDRRRIAFVSGLFGLKRAPGGGWRAFLFDFHRGKARKAGLTNTP